MPAQLRLYTINKGHMDDFVAAWSKGVYPLWLKHGFKIERAGVIQERNQFMWVLSHDDPVDWEAKEKAYYASPERKSLTPDPSQWIARAERYFISQVIPRPR